MIFNNLLWQFQKNLNKIMADETEYCQFSFSLFELIFRIISAVP